MNAPNNMPPSTDSEATLEALSRFVHELGHLKQSARTGWWLAGVRDPESVADHSFRTAVIAYALAQLAGADAGKAALLALFHDVAEARVGDIPSVGKKYLDKAEDHEVVWDQVAGGPLPVVEGIMSLIDEYRKRETLEARLAHDADQLECLAQAVEYVTDGHPRAEEWITGSVAAVQTDSGQSLAAALRSVHPDQWWKEFVANYRPAKAPATQDESH